MYYVLTFVAAVLLNLVPVFAPPTWTVLVALSLAFDLNPWAATIIGVAGATLGRFLLGLYAPSVARLMLSAQTNANMAYLGGRLSGKPRSTILFVFLYSLTPLSTSALFTAAAIARTRQILMLPPFFVAKLISYLILVCSAEKLASETGDVLGSTLSVKGGLSWVIGLAVLLAVLAVDWQALLERRELHWNLRVWRSRRSSDCNAGTL